MAPKINVRSPNVAGKRPEPEKKLPGDGVDPEKLAAFVGQAPDSQPSGKPRKLTKKGRRVQISHTLPASLLERIDAAAEELSMSRAAYLNMGAIQLLERGAVIDGKPRKREE